MIDKMSQQKQKVYLRCCYFEIYNDQVYDLLDISDMKLQEPLQVVEDKRKEFSVRGLIEIPVSSF
jgi:hypothetical protein